MITIHKASFVSEPSQRRPRKQQQLNSSLPTCTKHIPAKCRTKGGVGLVQMPTQIQALQAKVISRLLEPERLAWKVFQLYHLSQASQVQPLGYGASILFSTLSTDQLQLPARLSAYVAAFRALHPHRLQPVTAMLPSDVLNEPLFFNRQISWPAASSATTNIASPAAAFLTPQQKPLMLSAGITKVAHLRLSLQRQQPQMLASELSSVLLALPPAWRTIVSSAPASTWFQVLSASGRHLIQDVQTGQLHTINPHLQLQQAPPEPASNPSPVQVSWDPSRPWRGSAHQPAQQGSPLYLQGQLWGPHHLSLGVWGWGSQPAHQLVVRQAGLRLRLIRSFATKQTKHPLAPSGLTCRPRLLPMPTSGQSVAETLQAMELRWVASMQPSSRGTARLSSEMSASLPAWMTPSQTPRRHWSERQQQRQEQHQQQMQQHPAPQLPLDRAVADDLIDVLEACGSHPQQAQWWHIWELAGASYLDRQHRVLWWRLLHGSLMCGAYRAYIGRATPAQANCPFSCCIDPGQPQTISHLFITCPVAATVTDWLCRLWQAMTGYLPVVSAASLLAADTPSEQLPSDALLQAWHRLRLAVLHSIWAASQIAQATRSTQPSDASETDAIMASSPSLQRASLSSSSTSQHGHLARNLVALMNTARTY